MAITYDVVAASYGAVVGDDNKAKDVSDGLQHLLNNSSNGVIKIDNTTMGGDPAPGHKKHFGAIVRVSGAIGRPFACEESQTIDFS
ncbi:MAG TPA: hypothetical protein VLV54_21500 [Thermoanaerobaculia bacterium]|nr:hypothetical protein [Thermoanaerobaculia bacterium]